MAIPSLIGSTMGWHAGRMAPSSYSPPGGAHVWVFGSDIGGAFVDVEVGDEVHIGQYVDLTAIDLLTFAVRFRQTPEATVAPTLVCKVDGVTRYELCPGPGEEKEYQERTINVSAVVGVVTIRFDLEVRP